MRIPGKKKDDSQTELPPELATPELRRLNEPLMEKRLELLKRFYAMHRDVIQPAIDERVAQGKCLALWSAGTDRPDNRGLIFSNIYDPDATVFDCLTLRHSKHVRKPQKKYPMMDLPTATLKKDSIFLFQPSQNSQMLVNYSDKLGKLKMAEFVSIEDVIWEGVAKRNAAARAAAAQAAGSSAAAPAAAPVRVCSLTIMYNPDQDTLEAVRSYSHLVDKAYLYDNSPQPNVELVAQLKQLPNVEYVSGEGQNVGLATPNNIFIARAKEEGFDWLITFDQDSVAGDNMIQRMRAFAESPRCTPNIALVGPSIRKGQRQIGYYASLPEVSYCNRIIQSGMMHRLSALDEIGPYDDRLFIDEVENEYCARAREKGFDIVCLNNAPLLHQINDKTDRREINKYSAMRFYFRARNMMYVVNRYEESNPKYVFDTIGGLIALNLFVEYDDDPGEEAVAMMLGFEHYAEGKWPTYVEAMEELNARLDGSEPEEPEQPEHSEQSEPTQPTKRSIMAGNAAIQKAKRKAVKLGKRAKAAAQLAQSEGVVAAYEATRKRLSDDREIREHAQRNPDEISFYDVMFINGCPPTFTHPVRYRIDHKMEQLQAGGLTCCKIGIGSLTLDHVARARAFVVYRCPFIGCIGEFIELAKNLNKKVYFDIDDLVFDRRYTDDMKALEGMTPAQRAEYDAGVESYGRTLMACGAAITSTDVMAEELRKFVPEVILNRNAPNIRMVQLSNEAVRAREAQPAAEDASVRIGYFSGSSTHDVDLNLVAPAIAAVMQQRPQVQLAIVGEASVPNQLKSFGDRITKQPFIDWKLLPGVIADIDINIAPLDDTLFNRAKSENKWVEAALVQVPTVASNVGSLAQSIDDGETGLLASTTEEWEAALLQLVDDPQERSRIGHAAYERAQQLTTMETCIPLVSALKDGFTENIMIAVPSLNVSGGVLVALKHATMLQEASFDVTLVHDHPLDEGQPVAWLIEYDNHLLPVVQGRSFRNQDQVLLLNGSIDQFVATFWNTTWFFDHAPRIGRKRYLVQHYEVSYIPDGDALRLFCNATYNRDDCDYLTISRWCQGWLRDRFGKESRYAPNGINPQLFPKRERTFAEGERVRILVEGDSSVEHKNLDEAFRIVEQLDPERYEVWYLSASGQPKPWYRCDRFLNAVSHDEVGQVYADCDILLKTSLFESFSYPPLEMMATDGFVVAIPNGGNSEYLKHGKNCLLFESGDIAGAIAAIEMIAADEDLRARLLKGGRKAVAERDWAKVSEQVLALYE